MTDTDNKLITIKIVTVLVLMVVILSLVFFSKDKKSAIVVEPVATPTISEEDMYLKLLKERGANQNIENVKDEAIEEFRGVLSKIDKIIGVEANDIDDSIPEEQNALNDKELERQAAYQSSIRESFNTVDKGIINLFKDFENLDSVLEKSDLIQRFVLMVDNIAKGSISSKHSPAKSPKDIFYPKTVNDKSYMGEANYARFDVYVNLIYSLPTEVWVEIYKKMQPLMQSAYADIGYDEDFDNTLRQSIANVQKVKVPLDAIEVFRPSVAYHYTDEQLENQNDITKQIYRLGPYNATRVQLFLSDFLAKLDRQ